MAVYCLYHDKSGVSHLAPLTLKMPEGQTRGSLFVDRQAAISDGTAARATDWHCTPTLGISVILKGYLDIEVNRTAPQFTQLCTGDVLIVLDSNTSAQCHGHKGCAHGPEGMSALMLKLSRDDLPALAANFANWPQDLVV